MSSASVYRTEPMLVKLLLADQMRLIYWLILFGIAGLLFFQSGLNDAIALYKQHKYTDAASLFQQTINKDGERPDTVFLLAQSLFYAGNSQAAIPWLRKSVATPGRSAEANYMLGTAYLLTQRPDESVEPFAHVFGVNSSSAAAHLAAAEMMMRNELLDFASAQVTLALKLDSRIPQAHYLLGVIALAHGDTDLAIGEFQSEIKLNPNFAQTYYRLGDAWSRRQDWERAITELQRSIWLNPAFSGPYILLGKAYLSSDDLVNAEGVLRHAVLLDSKNRSANYLLGQTLIREGKVEEGRKLLELAAKLQLGSNP